MTKKAHLVGAVVASAGLLAAGAPAHADGVDNDGVNVGDGNNINLLPVTLCGNDIAILGAIIPVASPDSAECTQASITDHPSTGSDQDSPEDGRTEPGGSPERPGGGATVPGDQVGAPGETAPGSVVVPANQSSDLPEAPAPDPVRGHHAVTG